MSATRVTAMGQGPRARALVASLRRAAGRVLVVVLLACPHSTPSVTPKSARDSAGPPARPASGRDSVLDQRLARLDLRVAERDAQIEDLNARLDEARQEVVRAMAKLETLASRAEAASAMAEAEIAVQALRAAMGGGGGGGAQPTVSNVTQASVLLQQGSAEFAKQNYGGALYLANQAKSVAGVERSRLGGLDQPALRPGEAPFAVPLRLKAMARGNVREGPGGGYRVLFTVEPGAALTGYSTVDLWVRVGDEGGRSGWMFVTLVGRRDTGDR